jgi:hypothetical protein
MRVIVPRFKMPPALPPAVLKTTVTRLSVVVLPGSLHLASILLFMSVPLLWRNNDFGMYLAACACGLQNAMISTYSGAVVRTTHLSGMFTNLGIFLRGLPVDARRLSLCVTVVSGFLCGRLHFGFSITQRFTFPPLLQSASLAYGFYRLHKKRR